MNLGTEPPTLDPIKAVDLTSFTVIQNLMKGLTQFGSDMSIQPAVATHWEVTANQLTYTFHLDKTATWHDGEPVTAQHFIDGWQRALTPTNGADYAFFLYEIAGAEDYYNNPVDFNTVSVTALDNHKLKVTLRRPIPFFLAMLASPIALPVRKELPEQHHEQWTEPEHFIGNGPYTLASWQHDDAIKLSPNNTYQLNNVSPPTTPITMLMVNDPNTSVVMYENGELDFIETTTSIPASDVRRLEDHPDAQTGPIFRLNYIGFNTQKPPFNNPDVRKAFAHAVDRSWFPQLLKSGQNPNATWLTPGLFGYQPELGLQHNPTLAKQYLSKAGYPDGKGFPAVTLAYPTQPETRKEMEILQNQWHNTLGVDITLANTEWKMYLKGLKNDPANLFRLGWFVDYPDPDSFLSLFTSASGNNYTGWANPTYDELVNQAAITPNSSARQALITQAQHTLLNDATIIPLYNSTKLWLTKPHVEGLVISPLNLIDLQHLRLTPKAS